MPLLLPHERLLPFFVFRGLHSALDFGPNDAGAHTVGSGDEFPNVSSCKLCTVFRGVYDEPLLHTGHA